MALVTISGFPCSGKSSTARRLRDDFETRLGEPSYKGPKLKVMLVDDESCHVPRSTYDDSRTEKNGRANVFSAITRNMGPDTIVIADSPNYIKGFRYQLYCAAKEAHARPCTVHTAATPEQCASNHAARPQDQRYKQETFDNLIMRFEEPSSMVRWDSPLFVIPFSEDPPFDAIWDSIMTGAKAPPNKAVQAPPKPPPNALQVLSNTTSTIITGLLAHINAFPGSDTYPIPAPPASEKGKLVLHLPIKTPTLAEMQRHKRQFENAQIKAHTTGAKVTMTWSEGDVASKFVGFLEATWDTSP